ncbi:MAG TPA: cell division protein SepF [Propionibacteriaceae bacterium]|jgi:cell division inhibitor SepF
MAERLKRAAAWLGLVTDERYADYDEQNDTELTESISRDELVGQGAAMHAAAPAHAAATRPGGSHAASVTPLETRRAAPPIPSHATVSRPSQASPAPTPPTPTTSRAADLSRIVTVHPRTYNEARTIGEHFRDGVPVIMNLSDMEDVDAKRLVDFAAGLIFGLRGTIERVTSKVFLLSPQNVNVTAEDKERIAGGFFNQS